MTHTTQKGFTLVEMLTVLAIFSVITAVVIFNYNKFRSDTILTNMAYEIALSIREAQIYGVSVRGGGSGTEPFQKAYGVHLEENSGQYFLFVDGDSNGVLDGSCPTPAGNDTCVTPYTMQRKVIVTNIAAKVGASCTSSISDIDVVFKRPNPEPTIRTGGDSFNQTEITIQSPEQGTKRYINVYANGQIAVLTSPKLCE